jgi:hypothetical protein
MTSRSRAVWRAALAVPIGAALGIVLALLSSQPLWIGALYGAIAGLIRPFIVMAGGRPGGFHRWRRQKSD